ncbi:MAG: AraC family transcriptional regulator [Polaromonas sp.]|nr:AraC family transcriptional regulator [Polaromonas sp.]
MELLDHGVRKFPSAELLASSSGLHWRGVAAELRSHPAGDIPSFRPDQIEVTIAVTGNRQAVVSRKGGGVRQDTRVDQGAIWISPVGVCEDDIRITNRLPEILHVYLMPDLFEKLFSDSGGARLTAQSVRYLAGIRDELIGSMGLAFLSELKSPTLGGKLLAESLSLALTARLCQNYSESGGIQSATATDKQVLDDTRIRRVVDYMVAHLGDDISIDQLSSIASLSSFHFSRMFRRKTGVPPHRYLSSLRLDAAKRMLLQNHDSLSEIAGASGFSSQANFNRAFKQATGTTPKLFRSGSRSS